MGTHPIFESDFDCLTENENETHINRAWRQCVGGGEHEDIHLRRQHRQLACLVSPPMCPSLWLPVLAMRVVLTLAPPASRATHLAPPTSVIRLSSRTRWSI